MSASLNLPIRKIYSCYRSSGTGATVPRSPPLEARGEFPRPPTGARSDVAPAAVAAASSSSLRRSGLSSLPAAITSGPNPAAVEPKLQLLDIERRRSRIFLVSRKCLHPAVHTV